MALERGADLHKLSSGIRIRIAPLSVHVFFFPVILPVLKSNKKKSTDETANCSLPFSIAAGRRREGGREGEELGDRETFRALNFVCEIQ